MSLAGFIEIYLSATPTSTRFLFNNKFTTSTSYNFGIHTTQQEHMVYSYSSWWVAKRQKKLLRYIDKSNPHLLHTRHPISFSESSSSSYSSSYSSTKFPVLIPSLSIPTESLTLIIYWPLPNMLVFHSNEGQTPELWQAFLASKLATSCAKTGNMTSTSSTQLWIDFSSGSLRHADCNAFNTRVCNSRCWRQYSTSSWRPCWQPKQRIGLPGPGDGEGPKVERQIRLHQVWKKKHGEHNCT